MTVEERSVAKGKGGKKASEAERNFAAFQQMRFDSHDSGKFALLHKGELVLVFQTREDAFKTGLYLYKKLGEFTVQRIGERPASLGFVGTWLAWPKAPLASTGSAVA